MEAEMDREKSKKMWIADNGDGTYSNPILYTDYSDPDVIRTGEDYFMVASSFCNTPAVPLLHSRDLVNWKVINYVMDNFPFPGYERVRHGCGAWAPSIRYHEGVYYVFIPLPDEGIVVCKTADPWGKWSEPEFIKKAAGWIDPCPFWDEDGKAYMVNAFARSRIGFKSYLFLSPIEPDCSGIAHDGRFIYDGNDTQPTIEGPKLYKRNGYYYIFAPAGGVKTGWQTVLRSRNIYGPYEEKIVMRQGNSPVNGPHQGAWVDTPSGEDWFLHFQDVGNAGRIIHLQPMHWEDDWPVIGVNDEDGCGEPVMRYKKPQTNSVCLADAPEDSDFFEEGKPGLQWQWNANHKEDWYRMEGKGLVLPCLKTTETSLCDVSNLLLQKWPAPEFQITTCLHTEGMREGDRCGLISLGGHYSSLLICREKEGLRLEQRIGRIEKNDEVREELGSCLADILYLRMKVAQERYVSYEISHDGENYLQVGKTTEAEPGKWVGVKAGYVSIHEGAGDCGEMQVDYFVFEPLSDNA